MELIPTAARAAGYLVGIHCHRAGIAALYLASYRRILLRWARRHGYTILHSELRQLMMGPFFLRAVNSRHVYRVHVRER